MYVKYFFSDLEVEEVKLALKKEKSAVVLERLQAVFMTMQNLQRSEVVLRMNRSRYFVGNWVKNYKLGGLERLQEKRGGVHNHYLTSEQEEFVKDMVTHSSPKDCNYTQVTWSGALLVDLIENMYSKRYTREGVYMLLKRLGISYKKANKVDPKKSQKVIQEWKEHMKKNSRALI